jgi:hypothetical protein
MEPFIQTLVASLAAGAIAATQDVASNAINDTYVKVKKHLSAYFTQEDIEEIEKNPTDQTKLNNFADKTSQTDAISDDTLIALIKDLKEALKNQPESIRTIGGDFLDVQIGEANISDIIGFDTAVRIKGSTIKTLNLSGLKKN